MKKKLKIGALFLLGILTVVVFIYHELVGYGVRMGVGQMTIIWKAQPIDELLSDAEYPDSLKSKLLLIREIKQFAVDSLGLAASDNYEKVYDQQGKPILWIVTACPPYALNDYEWSFPLLGKFSYRGYFEKEGAERLAAKLEEEGYDTHVGEVTAWSTLGWFNDPVLSSMLSKPDGYLAELIIHELTHTTFYVKDSVDFNENLASYIGQIGALKFLAYRFGQNSTQLNDYKAYLADSQAIDRHMLRGAKLLDDLYSRVTTEQQTEDKQAQKEKIINQILQFSDTLRLYDKRRLSGLPDLPNNTYFNHFMRYAGYQGAIEAEYLQKGNGNVKSYVNYLKKRYTSLNN